MRDVATTPTEPEEQAPVIVPETVVIPDTGEEPTDAQPGGEVGATAIDRIVARARGLRPWALGLIAFALYLVASFFLWTVNYVTDFASRYGGDGGADARFYDWALSWTPWALSHGMNPLYTDRIFAPNHVDLTWLAFIPGPALVMWPVTRLFGPLVSLNLLLTLSPALAAWGAYLVCHRVTRAFWPSLAGGYLFGFSAFMVGHMHGHLNLVLIFPVPLAVYLVIRRIEGSLGWATFLVLMTLSLVGVFSVSTELFATATFFGILAFAVALVAARDRWKVVLRAGVLTSLAYVFATLILLPYLVVAIRSSPGETINRADLTTIDLLSPIVPRGPIRIGGHEPWDAGFTSHAIEDAGYIGVPLVILLVAFAVTDRKRRGTLALLSFVVLVYLFALGPVLHIWGRPHMELLPGKLLTNTPLLERSRLQRFPAYASLAIGVIAALWLARAPRRVAWARYGLVLCGAVFLLPRPLEIPGHHSPKVVEAFWTSPAMSSELNADENVFVIPVRTGDEMIDQAAAGFWFRMPQGYTGPLPAGSGGGGRLVHGLSLVRKDPYIPTANELATWLTSRDVTAVVVDDRARETFGPVLTSIGLTPTYEADGVSVWRSPSGIYAPPAPNP
jgi:hypothetical protein